MLSHRSGCGSPFREGGGWKRSRSPATNWSAPEAEMVARVPQIGYNLLSHIPRLESVAAVVLYQNKNFDGTGFPADKVAGEEIPIGARILRVLQDLLEYESAKASKDKALENMTHFPGRYDPRVVESVAAVFDICVAPSTAAHTESHPVGIKGLRVGSTLAAETRTAMACSGSGWHANFAKC